MRAHSNKPNACTPFRFGLFRCLPQLSYEQAHTLTPSHHPPSYQLNIQAQRKSNLPECCHKLQVCHQCCPREVQLRHPLQRKSHLEGRQWHGETLRERHNIARNDGMHRRDKLPPRTNGGTLTSTEVRESSNATKVSSRSTTRSASAMVTRTQKAQTDAPRKERSEHMY